MTWEASPLAVPEPIWTTGLPTMVTGLPWSANGLTITLVRSTVSGVPALAVLMTTSVTEMSGRVEEIERIGMVPLTGVVEPSVSVTLRTAWVPALVSAGVEMSNWVPLSSVAKPAGWLSTVKASFSMSPGSGSRTIAARSTDRAGSPAATWISEGVKTGWFLPDDSTTIGRVRTAVNPLGSSEVAPSVTSKVNDDCPENSPLVVNTRVVASLTSWAPSPPGPALIRSSKVSRGVCPSRTET